MRFKGQWAIALVCVVLGFMLSMQFKLQQRMAARDVTVAVQRTEDLTKQLAQVERERDALAQEISALRERQSADLSQQQTELKQQIDRLKLAAGLTAVKGPGVRVVLNDSNRPYSPGEDPNAFILHDEDLLKVVNELLAGGAEAISINGQRLVARSEIRCVGPTVMVNGVRIAPPLEILAVGDPKTLDSSLRIRGGVVDYLNLWGIQISVSQEHEVTVPAYSGSLQFKYANPVQIQQGG